MAVSTTTFAERIGRINSGTTIQAPSLPSAESLKPSKKSNWLPTVLLASFCLLGSGAAYLWVSPQDPVKWVMALAY